MASRAETDHDAARSEPFGQPKAPGSPNGPAPTLQGQNRRAAILLWLGVAGVFLLMASAWFFLFRAARSAQVESVPLATQGGRP